MHIITDQTLGKKTNNFDLQNLPSTSKFYKNEWKIRHAPRTQLYEQISYYERRFNNVLPSLTQAQAQVEAELALFSLDPTPPMMDNLSKLVKKYICLYMSMQFKPLLYFLCFKTDKWSTYFLLQSKQLVTEKSSFLNMQ